MTRLNILQKNLKEINAKIDTLEVIVDLTKKRLSALERVSKDQQERVEKLEMEVADED